METILSFYLSEKLMFCMFFLYRKFVIFLKENILLLLLVLLSAVIGLNYLYILANEITEHRKL